MFNILTEAATSGSLIEIVGWIGIAVAFLAAVIGAFITGKLTFKKILKNPKILKEIYDKTLDSLNRKINKAEKKEIKAETKGNVDKAEKYHIQKEEMERAKEKLLEPKLDNSDNI